MGTKEESFKQVNALLESARFPEAADEMKPWPKVWINQFVETYPQNYELIKHTDFEPFWEERRENVASQNVDSKNADSKFVFAKQNPLLDIDLVLGYVFYLLSISAKNKKDEKNYIKYLGLALKHHSIHAAQTVLNNILVDKKSSNENKAEILAATLNNWKYFADNYGTPGYLLLAYGYFQFLQLSNDQQNSDLYEAGCFCLWQNLILAELYETLSEASIHNAYFGKGLALSNPFNIPTIQQMKDEAATLIVDESIKKNAENRARLSFDASNGDHKIGLWRESKLKTGSYEEESPTSPKI